MNLGGENKENKKLTEDDIKTKIQDEKFKVNFFRVDGKKITDNQMKNLEKEKLQKTEEETYDPRKNRLKHGVVNFKNLKNLIINFINNYI